MGGKSGSNNGHGSLLKVSAVRAQVVDQHVHWESVMQPASSGKRGFPLGNQNDTLRMETLALLATGWNT